MKAFDPGLSDLRILVVDDEPNNVLLLTGILERAGYTRVESTTDPTEIVGMFTREAADRSEDTKRQALAYGARDFLAKPYDQTELLLRVTNLLQVRALQKELHERNLALEDAVADRTAELEQARLEILARLGRIRGTRKGRALPVHPAGRDTS